MAIIRNPRELNHTIDYVTTFAVFACISCLVLMLRFGFKANINFYSRKKKNDEELSSMTGAYRINRSEFFDSEEIAEPRKKVTPSMVQLPPSKQSNPPLRPTKSSGDLRVQNTLSLQLNKSTNDVSLDPRGPQATTSNRNTTIIDERKLNANNRDQSKLEKKRLAEQKARERKEEEKRAKEQERQEKLRKKREKEQAKEQAKVEKENKKKRPAPQPQTAAALATTTKSNPVSNLQTSNPPNQIPNPPPPPPQPQQRDGYPTNQAPYNSNTLQSSISRSSGPPPYSELNANPAIPKIEGNVGFSKPIVEHTNSWDLISQHRQQMSRPAVQALPKGPKKNIVMDLQYKLGNDDNSEA